MQGTFFALLPKDVRQLIHDEIVLKGHYTANSIHLEAKSVYIIAMTERPEYYDFHGPDRDRCYRLAKANWSKRIESLKSQASQTLKEYFESYVDVCVVKDVLSL